MEIINSQQFFDQQKAVYLGKYPLPQADYLRILQDIDNRCMNGESLRIFRDREDEPEFKTEKDSIGFAWLSIITRQKTKWSWENCGSDSGKKRENSTKIYYWRHKHNDSMQRRAIEYQDGRHSMWHSVRLIHITQRLTKKGKQEISSKNSTKVQQGKEVKVWNGNQSGFWQNIQIPTFKVPEQSFKVSEKPFEYDNILFQAPHTRYWVLREISKY
eukprot:TRINITY_DN2485_c0_g1_i2.p1 TRINITY_DN2485_c0_g1~~TRINITY_DN2485_c0_g1_i2.p1  ORF type:complete len:215 (+),score=38.80 TRINITY_DN2485_c0_g1_i2:559-1203(+)